MIAGAFQFNGRAAQPLRAGMGQFIHLRPEDAAHGSWLPLVTSLLCMEAAGTQPGAQIARQRGITVIGTASEHNQDYLRSLGAVATTYGAGLVDRVRALAPNGVDAALDIAGSGVIAELIELTGEPSKVLSIADFSAPQQGAQISVASTAAADAFREAVQLFNAGAFHIPVAKSFPLAEAAQAHAASAAGHVAGRFVITVS